MRQCQFISLELGRCSCVVLGRRPERIVRRGVVERYDHCSNLASEVYSTLYVFDVICDDLGFDNLRKFAEPECVLLEYHRERLCANNDACIKEWCIFGA